MIHLTVGCMRSGKSRELIDSYNRSAIRIGRDRVIALKPETDTRSKNISSRDRDTIIPAVTIGDDARWYLTLHRSEADHVYVDEFQFLSPEILKLLINMERSEVISNLYLFGLNLDFNRKEFDNFTYIMNEVLTEQEIKNYKHLKATCDYCGSEDAMYSKLVGVICPETNVLIGDDIYQCRCPNCWSK